MTELMMMMMQTIDDMQMDDGLIVRTVKLVVPFGGRLCSQLRQCDSKWVNSLRCVSTGCVDHSLKRNSFSIIHYADLSMHHIQGCFLDVWFS